MSGHTTWVISELYYPEGASTGRILTAIAEDLSQKGRTVKVLCAKPTYDSLGQKVVSRETHNGVEIRRCPSTSLDRHKLPFRAINFLTFCISTFFIALSSFKKGDTVLVVTNPPVLPFIVRAAAGLKGARTVLLIHDIYPEALDRAGILSETKGSFRFLDKRFSKMISKMDRAIVLGRDAKELIIQKLNRWNLPVLPIDIVPNYADINEVLPGERSDNPLIMELGWQDKFILQYAGNMGRTHGFSTVVETLEAMKEDPTVQFHFIGSGAMKKKLEEEVLARGLTNTCVSGYRPKEQLNDSLGACDAALITFSPRMWGVSIPSRMYNVMSAGRPIVGSCEPDSEMGLVIREHKIGWIAEPGSTESLISAIKAAQNTSIEERREMGLRARKAAVEIYSDRHTFDQMHDSLSAAEAQK